MKIDYIVEKVFDAFVDMGVGEIKEALIESDRKKILRNTCESFVHHGSLEFQEMRFVNDRQRLEMLSENDLDPGKTTEDLCETITPYVKNSIVSDSEISWECIIRSIAEYYKKRALATAGFKEIALKLDSMSESSDQKYENIQSFLEETRKRENEDEIRKRRIFDRYIQVKVNDLVSTLAFETYQLVFKKGYTTSNGIEDPVNPCLQFLNEIVEKDDNMLKDPNYWRTPIELVLGPNERLEPIYEHVFPSQFINQYVLDIETRISELLKFEAVLPESLYYSVMELELSIRTDLNMKYNNQMASIMVNTICREEDVNHMLVTWCKRAVSMGQYYKVI